MVVPASGNLLRRAHCFGAVELANLEVVAARSSVVRGEPLQPARVDARAPRLSATREAARPDGDGYLTLPEGPGLGVELNWEKIESLRVE